MTSKVPQKAKPASRAVCVMMTWDGIPPQLKNDETFVLPCAAFNLDVERAVTLPFRECENKSRESRRTPQTETADSCRGCISHLNVSLWCTMKVQHYMSRGTQCKCRPRVQWLHQCEVMSFRSCGCFPRMRSIWFRNAARTSRWQFFLLCIHNLSSHRKTT